MTTPPGSGPDHARRPHPPGPQGEPSALKLFADDIEVSFNEIGRTLSDEETAAVFLRTLDIWQHALEGSHAGGLITAEQLGELAALIRGMREAPRLI
ncbi:hypothetical protein [Streptomyces griseosporeus]|uniref:hypothetical protein n=1 Tax=Streptomyces griseosporeus TaxID=1910 RepID=UPI0036FEBB49